MVTTHFFLFVVGVAPQAAVGLLPQPPEATAGAQGITGQPQLAHLLRYVLCNSREGNGAAGRQAYSP